MTQQQHLDDTLQSLKSRWGRVGEAMLMHVALMTGLNCTDAKTAISWLYANGKDGDKVIDEIEVALIVRQDSDVARGVLDKQCWNNRIDYRAINGYIVAEKTVYAVCDGLRNANIVPTVHRVKGSFRDDDETALRGYVGQWLTRNATWVAAQQNPTVPLCEQIHQLELSLAMAIHLAADRSGLPEAALNSLIQTKLGALR